MEIPSFTEKKEGTAEELQRTEAWHADRLGMFTGSRMKDLMTCKSKKKGKNWSEHFWLFDFGDTALNYISERAIERATKKRIKTPTTWEMLWGAQHEDEGKEYFKSKTGLKVEEVGFTRFLKNAGASPDGKIGSDTAFEIKCPATVKSHRNLMLKTCDESHPHFWQLQSEMIALSVPNLTFATYSPLYPERSKMAIQECKLSVIHTNAMFFRLIVAEILVNKIIESNFLCDDRAELEAIANDVPTDFDGLNEWFSENIRNLKLEKTSKEA